MGKFLINSVERTWVLDWFPNEYERKQNSLIHPFLPHCTHCHSGLSRKFYLELIFLHLSWSTLQKEAIQEWVHSFLRPVPAGEWNLIELKTHAPQAPPSFSSSAFAQNWPCFLLFPLFGLWYLSFLAFHNAPFFQGSPFKEQPWSSQFSAIYSAKVTSSSSKFSPAQNNCMEIERTQFWNLEYSEKSISTLLASCRSPMFRIYEVT